MQLLRKRHKQNPWKYTRGCCCECVKDQKDLPVDPLQMESFVKVPVGSDFPLNNLPYGAYTLPGGSSRKPSLCVALGEQVVDLAQLEQAGCFTGPILSQHKVFSEVRGGHWVCNGGWGCSQWPGGAQHVVGRGPSQFACHGVRSAHCCLMLCVQGSLNAFMALGKPAWQEARQTLSRLLSTAEGRLRDDAALRQAAIIPQVGGACVRSVTV